MKCSSAARVMISGADDAILMETIANSFWKVLWADHEFFKKVNSFSNLHHLHYCTRCRRGRRKVGSSEWTYRRHRIFKRTLTSHNMETTNSLHDYDYIVNGNIRQWICGTVCTTEVDRPEFYCETSSSPVAKLRGSERNHCESSNRLILFSLAERHQ